MPRGILVRTQTWSLLLLFLACLPVADSLVLQMGKIDSLLLLVDLTVLCLSLTQ